jgi:hypothetical protein
MNIRVMNFKPYDRGSLLGFFTLGYGGFSIQNCKLMAGNNGGPAWFAFPQIKGEQDGEVKYFDILHLSNPEREAARALILAELQAQGHIKGRAAPKQPRQNRTPEGENLDQYYSSADEDDIGF